MQPNEPVEILTSLGYIDLSAELTPQALVEILTFLEYIDRLLSAELTPQALEGLAAHEIQILHEAINGLQKHLKPLEIAAGRHELNA